MEIEWILEVLCVFVYCLCVWVRGFDSNCCVLEHRLKGGGVNHVRISLPYTTVHSKFSKIILI